MGALSSNGSSSRSKAKNRRDGIDPLLVGQANNNDTDEGQQTYGHAPFHALWRPGSSPATAASALRRHFRENFRVYLLVTAVLALVILLLWLFMLSPIFFGRDSIRKSMSKPTISTATVTSTTPRIPFTTTERRPQTVKTVRIQPYKLPKDSSSTEETIRLMKTTSAASSTTQMTTSATQMSTSATQMATSTRQKATSSETSTTEEILITVDEDEDNEMMGEAVVFEKIELSDNSNKSDGKVLAKLEQSIREGLTHVTPTEKNWPDRWSPPRITQKMGYRPPIYTPAMRTSSGTTAKRPSTTTATTTTQKPPETSSSGETVDDDQEDLFWMRDRTTDQRTLPSRPTLVEKPVMAIQSGYDHERDRWRETVLPQQKPKPKQQSPWQHQQLPGQRKSEPTRLPSGDEDDEIDEIINSIDKDAATTTTTRRPQQHTNWIGIRNKADGIKPAFEFGATHQQGAAPSWTMPTRPKPTARIEPVWRIPPPGEGSYIAPRQDEDKLKEHSSKLSFIPPPGKVSKEIARKRRNAPTMVTALLDIGRGEWLQFTRHFDQYMGFLENMLLSLQNNFVIYCERSVIDHLVNLGAKIDWNRLQIVEIKLSDLPFYQDKKAISQILASEQQKWSETWDLQMKGHPEAMYAEYNILVNSKPYFLHNASKISQFQPPENGDEGFFVWVDAGYGHGSKNVFPRGVWTPNLIPGKITLVQLTHNERVERYTLEMVYRKKKSVVSGGFMAGDPATIRRFYGFFLITFDKMLENLQVDDDQTTILMTIRDYNSTFNLINGSWFDGFKLLPSQ